MMLYKENKHKINKLYNNVYNLQNKINYEKLDEILLDRLSIIKTAKREGSEWYSYINYGVI